MTNCPSAVRNTVASARSTASRYSTSIPKRRVSSWVASSVNEVIESRRDGVLTLRLNQPEVRNALGPAMVRALYGALLRAREEASVAAVIITATGDAFSVGADLRVVLVDRTVEARSLETTALSLAKAANGTASLPRLTRL